MIDHNSGAGTPVYKIERDVAGSFFASDSDGRAVLLVPVIDGRLPIGRASGDVILGFERNVQFALPDKSFDSNAAVIECANESLRDTFMVLGTDIAKRLSARDHRPAPHQVSQALARWEELLRARRELSRDDEVGLWGELWTLLQLQDTEAAVSVWRGPNAEFVDFVGGGVGIECKTAFRRLQHFVSQQQLTRPLGDVAVYMMSWWVDEDTISGQTLNDLVSEIAARTHGSVEFEEKLLGAGYSRADSHRYRLKLRVLERPMLFDSASIPRVREADPGVSHIRFLATLPEAAALSPARVVEITAKLASSQPS